MNEERSLATIDESPSGMTISDVAMNQAKLQLARLQEFVKNIMVDGEDFGKIPGTPKPTLYKSGAEKLCEVYGLSIRPDVTQRIENWTEGFFHYEVRVDLISKRTGQLVAAGVGSSNSKENRYKNQDVFVLVNTILKMAKKRALVDATLSATRSSAIFGQDAEDDEGKKKRKTRVVGTPEHEQLIRDVYTLGKQTGFIKDKPDEKGRPQIDFEAFGHFLKECGLTGTVQSLSDADLIKAVNFLKAKIDANIAAEADQIKAKLDEQEATGELDEQSQELFERMG